VLDCISVAYSLRDNDVFPSVNMEPRLHVMCTDVSEETVASLFKVQ